MFLESKVVSNAVVRCWRLFQVWMPLLMVGAAHTEDLRPRCFLDASVYDATGDRLAFKIAAVSPHGEGVDLLTIKPEGARLLVDGNRLYFSENLIGRVPLDITISDRTGMRTKSPVVLTGCQQRMSFQLGERDTGADIGWSTVKGQITGCRLVGDWWIRAMPMFGGHDGPTFEGYIYSTDGRFTLNLHRGERHIVIIGRDKQPIKVFGFDLVSGGNNDTGIIDLTGLCPK